MVFPTFFNLSLTLAIRCPWSVPQSAPGLVFADCIELLHLRYNQSDFGIDRLVMSMCRVVSCVVGRGCLLWPLCSLGKTLLAFAVLHSVVQGQTCLLLQVILDFLLLHSSPQMTPDDSSPFQMTLHMDITRWSIPKSDWLYSLQIKMEKLYTVSKNKTRGWLWLRSWAAYCQIQT